MATFNPNDYLINLKGKKYLQVAHRVLWFKTENPNGAISTDVLQTDPYPLVKAFITIDGVLIATGHGTAQVNPSAVYKGREVEKAETAAIGRALANAGYGTQFSEMLEDDSRDLADPPQNAPKQGQLTASEKAIAWAKSKNYDTSKFPKPTQPHNEDLWRKWCEDVLTENEGKP